VVTSLGEALARPASTSWALAVSSGASWADGGACTLGGELRRWLAESNRSEAVTCLVLRWPAGWALLAWCVDRLLSLLTEAKLCEALACVITSCVQALAWPAALVALTSWVGAVRADGGACTGLWELLWWITEANCCEAVARLVLSRPTRWTLLARSVDWLLSILAEAKLGEALASRVRSVVKAAARPARIIALAGRVCALWTKLLAAAVSWKLCRCKSNQSSTNASTHHDDGQMAVCGN